MRDQREMGRVGDPAVIILMDAATAMARIPSAIHDVEKPRVAAMAR